MQIPPRIIKAFQKEILAWYAINKRDLPWRDTPVETNHSVHLSGASFKKRDPYHILVSEVMLQQTQVSRVIPKYEAWLRIFPTVQSLAKAKTSDVLRLWSGLGYNRRALYLQKTAKDIVEKHEGKWPQDIKTLQALPGIGEYTARALLCFAFDQQVAVVDTNIRKVILLRFVYNRHSGDPLRQLADGGDSRIKILNQVQGDKLGDPGQARMTKRELQRIADQLLPKGKAYEWNQALMDYSASVLAMHRVPTPKQSRFTGSNRYYRGQVLQYLLKHQTASIMTLGRKVKQGFGEKDALWFQELLLGLSKDGFVRIHKGSVSLI
ncbi:MAG: A/G-specific adenine glycosylase [Candidatus Levybacteria bacterium]|nr:A/G-specific adenine glycosylase [Candidatus Levybacteria bacterium]